MQNFKLGNRSMYQTLDDILNYFKSSNKGTRRILGINLISKVG